MRKRPPAPIWERPSSAPLQRPGSPQLGYRRSPPVVAGFLAGYCGSTCRGYATDLCSFTACAIGARWTCSGSAEPIVVFGRWMEETGKPFPEQMRVQ